MEIEETNSHKMNASQNNILNKQIEGNIIQIYCFKKKKVCKQLTLCLESTTSQFQDEKLEKFNEQVGSSSKSNS